MDRTLVFGNDRLLAGVAWLAEEDEEPCICLSVLDPRGSSMSVNLNGLAAKTLAEALTGAAEAVHEAEGAYLEAAARQAVIDASRYADRET